MTAEATGRELGMPSKSTALEISAICGVFILLALWGIVWDITSGLLTSSIDGIMLALVCAMMAGIFFLIMLMELAKSGIIPTPAFLRPAPKPAAAAKAPAAAAPAAKTPVAGTPAAATKPSAPAAGAPPAVAPKPASPTAATPGAPPTAPRPAAPAPAVTPASPPAKPTAAAPTEPPTPTVPEK